MSKLLMACYFLFIIGTIFCLMGEGGWFGTEEVSFINQMTGYSTIQIQEAGGWGFALQALGFITYGIPKMITWNYWFFDDSYAALFKWTFLYAISAGVLWSIVQVFAPVMQGVLTGLRTLWPG